jgi:hypothetical protein
MPPKKNSSRANTKRNLLQNFNIVSNKTNNKKLKTISLSNALKQMKIENDSSKKVRKRLQFHSNSSPNSSNSKTKETTMNHLLKAMEKIRSKKRNSNSSTKKSKSLSPLPFKMVPKRNYHKTNVPNVIVQNKNRKKGGILNSLPNEFFRSKSNSNKK